VQQIVGVGVFGEGAAVAWRYILQKLNTGTFRSAEAGDA